MTRNEFKQEIFAIVGDMRKVEKVLELMGRISPEPDSGNIKRVVPNYNSHLIRKVGRQKMQFTVEQRAAAKAVLRKLGMI